MLGREIAVVREQEMLRVRNSEPPVMRYELSDNEWRAIRVMLPNKPRGVTRVDDRRVLNGIFWVLRSGAPWRDLPDVYRPIHRAEVKDEELPR
jgi:hypothetical protein